MTFDKNVYQAKVDLISAQQDVSSTLSKLLRCISPHLTELSLPTILMGNLVTSIVANRYTNLQIGLAVLVERKAIVDHLYDYCITCSYDELRFRTSAAVWTANRRTYDIICHHKQGLVQVTADNFDCNISSMNGKKQTHALAMILVQPDSNEGERDFDRAAMEIPRLQKHQVKDADLPDVPFVQNDSSKCLQSQGTCYSCCCTLNSMCSTKLPCHLPCHLPCYLLRYADPLSQF